MESLVLEINELTIKTTLEDMITQKSHKAFADYCFVKYGLIFKVVHVKGPAYIYDDSICLWKEITIDQLGLYLAYFINYEMVNLLQKYYSEIDKLNISFNLSGEEKEKQFKKLEMDIKETMKMQKNISCGSFVRSAAKWLAGRLVEKENGRLFDNMEGYLPLKSNSIINLRTREVSQRQKEHYFTYEIPVTYDPTNNDPRFEQFINTIMLEDQAESNKEKSTCLQTLLGYAISGSTKERILAVMIGEGSNGKSTLLQVLRECLGPLLTHVDKCVIMNKEQSKGAANPELHSLRRCRMAMINETEKNEYLNESVTKRITGGGDTVTSRELYQGIQEWIPKFCPIMITNNPPKCSNDPATLSRLLFIEFLAKFVNSPSELHERKKDLNYTDLIQECSFREAFLKWIIEGALRYYTIGLIIPESVKAKSDEYKSAQDTLKLFMDQDVILEDQEGYIDSWVNGSVLFDRYIKRCNNEQVPRSARLKEKEFGVQMKKLKEHKKSNGIKYHICLTTEESGPIGSLLSF